MRINIAIFIAGAVLQPDEGGLLGGERVDPDGGRRGQEAPVQLSLAQLGLDGHEGLAHPLLSGTGAAAPASLLLLLVSI